jgi:hypothetical protein
MTTVIVGMCVAMLIAGVVVALVAVPARRSGRELLSSEGEQLVQAAREKTVDVVEAAREKVGELRSPGAGQDAANPRHRAPSGPPTEGGPGRSRAERRPWPELPPG